VDQFMSNKGGCVGHKSGSAILYVAAIVNGGVARENRSTDAVDKSVSKISDYAISPMFLDISLICTKIKHACNLLKWLDI
jgi:hypothetical protein